MLSCAGECSLHGLAVVRWCAAVPREACFATRGRQWEVIAPCEQTGRADRPARAWPMAHAQGRSRDPARRMDAPGGSAPNASGQNPNGGLLGIRGSALQLHAHPHACRALSSPRRGRVEAARSAPLVRSAEARAATPISAGPRAESPLRNGRLEPRESGVRRAPRSPGTHPRRCPRVQAWRAGRRAS